MDGLPQEIDAGLQYARTEPVEVLQEPDTGTAMHTRDEKRRASHGTLGEVHQLPSDPRIIEILIARVTIKGGSSPWRLLEGVIATQVVLGKDFVDESASGTAESLPFVQNNSLSRRITAVKAA